MPDNDASRGKAHSDPSDDARSHAEQDRLDQAVKAKPEHLDAEHEPHRSPPLSLQGIYESLRAPAFRDMIYATKAFTASALALTAGFSQNLQNPYWSVLTVYIIVNPPGAGAIRSKALFRLLGTSVGGALVLAATSLFSDQTGVLVTATIVIIVGAMFLNQADKTPFGYTWFAVAVTAAVIALGNLSRPDRMFELATARVGEISLGILMTLAVDCVWPEPMTPAFLEAMADWRRQARDFAVAAIGLAGQVSDGEGCRPKLRDLVKAIQVIDAKATQLPFDVVSRAPRRRDLDLVRRQMVAVVAGLSATELRTRALESPESVLSRVRSLLDAVTAWLRTDGEPAGAALDTHLDEGRALAGEAERVRDGLDPADGREALVQHALLSRLATFLCDWCDLLLALRAVDTGQRLPKRLEAAAARAKPVRSVDYLATTLDLVPLILALSVTALIWYLTAWDGGPTALLFAFAGCIFLVGQGQILESTVGLLACVLISFGLVFLYEFVVLPRVTDLPVLLMVLGCAMLPLGLLMSTSMAGMLIAALTFSFLGLQNAYAADFVASVQTLIGSLVGLLIAVICLRVGAYDHARFATRRLAAAVHRDVLDVARATRPPDPDRFGFLAFYRISLYFPAADAVGGAGPHPDLLSELSIGYHLLRLRRLERAVSPGTRKIIDGLRRGTTAMLRGRLAGRADDATVQAMVVAATRDPAIQGDPARDDLLDSLTGLELALGNAATREPQTAR